MRKNEVTEKLRKPDNPASNTKLYLIIGAVALIIILAVVVFIFSKSSPFSNSSDESGSETKAPKVIQLEGNEILNDASANSKDFKSESGNTTGNLGNYGKVCTVGNVSYVSTFDAGVNYLWKLENDKYTLIYSMTNDTNGINDLQYYNGRLYMKSGGVFGYLDLNSNEFTHIALAPGDSLPISPRIYNDKLYYITYEGINQFYIYEANLDGSSNRRLSTLDPGLRLENFVAFTIKDDLIYLFVNTIIGDFTQKESKIQTVSLQNGAKNTLYTTNCYIDEYISYSEDWIYFLEASSTSNSNKSIYKLVLDGSSPILVLDGTKSNITAINSNASNLFYQDNGIIYACDLDGANSVQVGDVRSLLGNNSPSQYKNFLCLSNNKIFAEERIRESDGLRHTYLYEAKLDDYKTFHQVQLDYS